MAKNIFVKVRATDDERNRWMAAAAKRGIGLSEMVRRFLDRAAKKALKND